ncbi:MAG: NADH-quinone oxidoreductase subunit A [bacterium]
MPADTYLPLIVFIFVGLIVAAMFYIPAIILGPSNKTAVKLEPFECGNDPVGEPTVPFNPRFYQVAILFLVFDVEVAFLYPWAMIYAEKQTFAGLVIMGLFVTVLLAALIFVVRKGVLKWV